MKKIIGVILIILFISGCSKKHDFDKMSDVIINFHSNLNYDISDMSESDIKLLNDFKASEATDNKVINLSKLPMFNDYFDTTEEDTEGVYENNGEYYIKYKDINFKSINNEYIAVINAGGKELEVNKKDYPILYYDTNNDNYKYKFIKKEKTDNEINYYYRSYKNSSMLTINYLLEDEVKINLIYSKYFNLEEDNQKNSNFMEVIFVSIVFIIIVLICAFGGYKLLKNREI